MPKTGLMLVGWGGNNGTTVTASILANKHNITWRTKVPLFVLYCLSLYAEFDQGQFVYLEWRAESRLLWVNGHVVNGPIGSG